MPDGHEIIRPYPGLRPFESWEGEIFFGREEHTNRLLDILKERHFLAVIGPSGSGKSSLVRAGLLPALPLGSLGTGSDWRIALMRPGNRPMQSLTHALLARSTLGIELVGEERIPQNESDMTPDVALIEADLRRGPLGLIDIVQDARTRQTGKEAFNLLVLVDQFEELFTYADAGGRKADEAEAFVNLLLAPPTVPDAGIYIVLTMRTDFLGNCVRFLELPDAINRAQYLTPRLTREQIERAITSPAYLFDGDVEPTLVTELINSVSNDPDQLPILQHALSRMWDEASQHQNEIPCIAWNDFNAVGGITNALSRHADEILASLSPRNRIEQPLCPGQQAAADLFRAITEQRSAEAGGQAVRRPQSLVRIAQCSGRNWQDFEPVIDAYAKEGVNFLHINSTLNSDTIVDISHEALIRQWQRLRNWVTQEARLAGEYKRFRGLGEDFKSGSGALLTGAALERALEWQNGTILKGPNNDAWRPTANWADRYRKNEDVPANTEFNEVLKFIEDSHAVKLKAKRRARIINWALITLTGLSLIGMFSAVGFAYQSHKNQIATEAALLWTPLDFSLPIINVSEKQSSGLLKLEAADDDRKGVFLDQLMKDQALAEHFINNPEVIMTALVGISPTRRDNILHRLDEEPRQDSDIFRLARFLILSELDAQISSDDIMSAITIKDNKDIVSRKKLGQRIKTQIGKMAEPDLEALFNRILATFNDSKTVYEFEPRAEALTAIIDRIPQEKLDKFAEYLLTAIKTVNNPLQLDILKQSLAHVAAKMQDEQLAGVLANQLFAALKASLDTGLINAKRTSLVPGQIEAFGKGLEILAPKLSATVAEKLVEQLVILVIDSKNSYAFKTLGQSLVTVAAKIPENQPQTAILADHIFAAMKESIILEQFDALGHGLAAITSKLPVSKLQPLTTQLLNSIKDFSQIKIIGYGLLEDDFVHFRTLGQSLAAMIIVMPEEQAVTFAYPIFSLIKNYSMNKKPQDSGQLDALGQGLAEAAAKMTQTQADSFVNQLIAVMKDEKATFRQFSAIGEAVAKIAKRISASKAQELTKQFITDISKQEKKQSYIRFEALGKGLAELAARGSKEQAGALVEQLITAIMASENRMQTMAFGPGLAKAAAQIPASQVVEKTNAIIFLFKDSNDTQLKVLVKALEAMANNLPEDQVLVVTDPFIAAINDLSGEPKDVYRSKIKTLGRGLKALTAKVPEIQVEELINRLIAEIKASNDPDKNEALGKGLAEACKKTAPAKAITLADKLVTAMKDSTSPSHLEALGQGLSALIEKVPETRRALAKQLAEIILQTQNSSQLQVFGQVLTVVTGELKPDDKMLVQWFELLKNPLTPRNILAAAIFQRLSDSSKGNHETWDLIEWAKQHHPAIDLEAPLKEPDRL